MSEFQIDRPPSQSEPSRSVDSSGRTDADGGGGTNFVFFGDGGDSRKQEREKPPRPPLPIEPPVSLSLSSAASCEIGVPQPPGDYGAIGPVLPPEGIADAVDKELAKAKAITEAEGPEKPQGQAPGSTVDIEA